MEPKISVIMTAYNSSKHIGEAILSILNQTLEEFELIVVDDCSLDDTSEIVRRYADKDPRVILLKNTVNLKPALSRNKALEIARGKYVAVLDSDDVSLPNRLREHYDYNGKILGRKYYPKDFKEIKFVLLLKNPFVHSGILGRKQAMTEFGYSNDHLHSEDLKLYSNLVSKYKITNLDNILIKYRQSAGSVTLEPETRQIQLANANKIHHDLINQYLFASPVKVKIAIETIHKMRHDLFSILSTIVFCRRLTLSYVEKEQPNIETRKTIWSIYSKEKEMLLGQIFRVHVPKLYSAAKKTYRVLSGN